MSTVIALLTSRLAGPIALVLMMFALAFGVSQCSGRLKAERTVTTVTAERDKALKDLKQCQGNEAVLNSAISGQNKAIADLKTQADMRQKLSEAALNTAARRAEDYRKRADAVMHAKPKGDVCEAADALILESLR